MFQSEAKMATLFEIQEDELTHCLPGPWTLLALESLQHLPVLGAIQAPLFPSQFATPPICFRLNVHTLAGEYCQRVGP